jgi:hypothetical protein
MAFTLAFDVTERNDNKLLTITDTSGEVATGTATGWGAPNPVYTTIVASGGAHTLELEISITISNGTKTTYDVIDLYTEFAPVGGFAAITDLVFPLDCSMLKESGIAMGTSDDEFPDGIYEITYIYDDGLVTEDYTTYSELIHGKVKNATYQLLRMMSTSYEYEGYIDDGAVLGVFVKTYLDAMINAFDEVAREASVLGQLYTLERILINESTYEI